MPRTSTTFIIATLAIAGIFPFAGFFSKDEILYEAWIGGNKVVWGVLAVAAFFTAFYMMRLTYLVFFGRFRGGDEKYSHVHETPNSMTVPLMILGVLSVIGGFVGIPAAFSVIGLGDANLFHHWLAPAITEAGAGHGAGGHAAEHAHSLGTEWALMVLAMTIALVALALGWSIYKREGVAERMAQRLKPIYTTLRNLYWVDELYEALILRPFYALSRAFTAFDKWVVDGLVNAAGVTAELTGQIIKLFQTGLVRNYALVFLLGVVAILYYLMTI
jgi:NADH-quinone oxidoreductase subunit L